jgi:predicted amidophosphoribosyltransferase
MRICPNCNTKNKESAKFCAQCGHPFGSIIRPPRPDGGSGGNNDQYYVGTTQDGVRISYDGK